MCMDCLQTFDKAKYCDLAQDLDTAAHHRMPSGCEYCVWEIIEFCEGRMAVTLRNEERKEQEWRWVTITLMIGILLFCCAVIVVVAHNHHEKESNPGKEVNQL